MTIDDQIAALSRRCERMLTEEDLRGMLEEVLQREDANVHQGGMS